jgi:hypothetical protein
VTGNCAGRRADGRFRAPQPRGDDHRDKTLQYVEEERESGDGPGSGAQNVGCPDIPRSDCPDIAEPGGSRQQKPEGNRAKNIAQ